MIVSKTKRKIVIESIGIGSSQIHRPFDIRLPANVVRVTGVLVTAFDNDPLGTVILQANDRTDVFYKAIVRLDNQELSDEALFGVEDAQFTSDRPWITGYVPRFLPVNVAGDTIVIHGWFKSSDFAGPFTLRIYLEYEMAEELVEVEAEEEVADEDIKEDLEPQEIHL